MVTHVNFAIEDRLAERVRSAKDEHGWTWEEFIEAAANEFEAHGDD